MTKTEAFLGGEVFASNTEKNPAEGGGLQSIRDGPQLAAECTVGEADRLRRVWRKRGGLAAHQQQPIARMRIKGYTKAFANRIAEKVEGFGSYGFTESHAARTMRAELDARKAKPFLAVACKLFHPCLAILRQFNSFISTWQ